MASPGPAKARSASRIGLSLLPGAIFVSVSAVSAKAEGKGTWIPLAAAQAAAVHAARAAGEVLRANQHAVKRVDSTSAHDIKLELDVRCQKKIERTLRRAFPLVPVLGEEGVIGDADAPWRWVVDPIDGTVNYTFGIPHACVSIALQARDEVARPWLRARGLTPARWCPGYQTVVGVVHDPFVGETWTALADGPARLNGRRAQVSRRRRLEESIITVGFAKQRESLEHMLPIFTQLVHRVLKLRIMGSAALGLTYVASGRFDGYTESGVRLWDIAAGALIVERAGGRFWGEALPGDFRYRLLATNGPMHRALAPLA